MPGLPTVEIVNEASPSGFTRINEADFDTSTMTLREGEDATSTMNLTREAIDAMEKEEVREILDAHGAEYDARTGIEKLRELAKQVVFVDL
ncbi:hypothetical protein [Ponticoccus litoralis]|uniref:Uncharacterized protein n=1 Tax=Ponticoccus litoralis TaxID=422297 RepID=A0AAW9SIN1_9RHOB